MPKKKNIGNYLREANGHSAKSVKNQKHFSTNMPKQLSSTVEEGSDLGLFYIHRTCSVIAPTMDSHQMYCFDNKRLTETGSYHSKIIPSISENLHENG